MTATRYPIRPLAEDDFLPIDRTLTDWWDDWGDPPVVSQRRLLMPPRLFFQHFADTSAVVSDAGGDMAAYLIGFMSQSRAKEAYIHFVGSSLACASTDSQAASTKTSSCGVRDQR